MSNHRSEGGASSIAVVMATFNGGLWLSTQLQSLANQSRLPDQLVISDDGSTDDTVSIAQTFALSAPFSVVMLEGPRLGDYGENFWFACQHADTELIAWCDQDDYWHPQKLEVCEKYMHQYGVPFLTHSATLTDAHLESTGRIYPRYRRTRVLKPLVGDPLDVAFGLTTVVRRELVQTVQWDDRPRSLSYDKRMGHDEAISLLSFATARRLEVKDVLVDYRQHERSFVGAPKPVDFLTRVRSALEIESTEYSDLANTVDSYSKFIIACAPHNKKAIDYFTIFQLRCRRRSKIHQSATRRQGWRNLFASLRKGDYGRKTRGGFGGLAFARDTVALAFNLNGLPPQS